MKKNIFVIGLSLIAVMAFAGGKKEKSELPDFVMNPPVADDAIYGVGYAEENRTDQSITIAKMRARADIARQLKVQVQSAMTDYFQKAGASPNAQTLEFVESITRELVNQKLTNLRTQKTHQTDAGSIWVLLSYDKNSAVAAFEESAKNQFVRSEEAAYSEFKAKEAAAMLDKLLDEKPTKSEPVESGK